MSWTILGSRGGAKKEQTENFLFAPFSFGGIAAFSIGLGMESSGRQARPKPEGLKGRADLRAATQPGPPAGRASPKTF